MDSFNEKIIKKTPTIWETILRYAGFVAAAVATPFVLPLSQFGFLLVFFLFYGAFLLYKFIFTEYEYCVTNGEMDVDRIQGRSRRKRLITVNGRKVELMAALMDPTYGNEANGTFDKTIDASSGSNPNGTYFLITTDKDEKRTLVLFEPTYGMVRNLRAVNPQNIHHAPDAVAPETDEPVFYGKIKETPPPLDAFPEFSADDLENIDVSDLSDKPVVKKAQATKATKTAETAEEETEAESTDENN